MFDWLPFDLAQFESSERLLSLLRAAIIFIGGSILARLVSRAAVRVFESRLDPQNAMILRRLLFYTMMILVFATGLHELGFHLQVVLGAAGILTVALGFASQTSVSNIISGLFLVAERPFEIGDLVRIGDLTGEVLSIDLLSVKIRTFDNLFVRVPNESLIKEQITNLTRFPIRRIDLQIGVAYKENLEEVEKVLREVADANPLSLDEPQPLLIFRGFGNSALEMQFSVWARRENFLKLKNSIHFEIKRAFDARGIEIPFPHTTLYSGSVTDPFPIRIVGDSEHPATP